VDINHWLDEVVVPLLANHRRWYYPVLAGASRVILAVAKAASNSTTAVGGRPKCEAATMSPTAEYPTQTFR